MASSANLCSFCTLERPGASIHCLDDLERFMTFITLSAKGRKGNDAYFARSRRPRGKTVLITKETQRNSWNNFCGWCKRMGHPVSKVYMDHMTKVRSLWTPLDKPLLTSVQVQSETIYTGKLTILRPRKKVWWSLSHRNLGCVGVQTERPPVLQARSEDRSLGNNTCERLC
jgi:hypothetical protein